ncbi:MAG: VOC family protein [Ardenticatenaceae bacterium]|nr:VOC family protein [Ardenticatenaceae bacterium]
MSNTAPPILATNAFYYYRDVESAWRFYRDVFGFETTANYEHAKIMKVASSSYLTLVDAERGMHTADEPKSVTLALVTDEVEQWFEYLISQGAAMHRPFEAKDGRAHDGFVALDPEGYFIEVERFNPHQENTALLPVVQALPITPAHGDQRPPHLGVRGTVLWLYYRDLSPVQKFYEALFGVEMICDQGWAKIYQISSSGFIGLVDGKEGLHQAADQKGVTVSFFTDALTQWFEHAKSTPGFALRSPEIFEQSGRVNLFVGYDPEGYFLEWDQFKNS